MDHHSASKPYAKPRLRAYGRMDAVTRKSFGKNGFKKDPHNVARVRT